MDAVHHTPARYTADEALLRLVAGNERFLRGEARFPTVQKEILADLARGQHPYATIIGCSDSRVPPELVFDAGFGELFIVRVAGNVISPEVMGTLQYAVSASAHAARCRSRTRRVRGGAGGAGEQGSRRARSRAHRAAPDEDRPGPRGTGCRRIFAGASWRRRSRPTSAGRCGSCARHPEGQARMAEGIIKLVGAVYDLATGSVRFLPD